MGVDDGLVLSCLVPLAEDVVVARCDRVDACLIGVRVVCILADINRLLLDVEADAVGSRRDVRHTDVYGEDGLLDHQAARRGKRRIVIAQRCRVAVFFGCVVSVEVYRRFARRHRLERDAHALCAREQVVGRARILIVPQLVIIYVGICDIVPRKSKAFSKCEVLAEAGRRVGYGLLSLDSQFDVCRILIRCREAVDVFGDELDAIRVAELRGGDRDAARAFSRIAPVGIVAELVGGHALWQCPCQFGHVDVIGLVVDGDVSDGGRCWQAEAHDDVVAGRAVLILSVDRVSRCISDFAGHRNRADARECLAKGIAVFVDGFYVKYILPGVLRRHVARCRGLCRAYLVTLLHRHTIFTAVDIVARDGRAGRAAPREIKALADKHDGKVARVICGVCRAVYVQARCLAVGGQRVEDAVDRDVVIVALAHAAEDVCRHPRAHLLVVIARARLDAHDVAVGCDALARELPCHAHI